MIAARGRVGVVTSGVTLTRIGGRRRTTRDGQRFRGSGDHQDRFGLVNV
jgi:hypothetical protein